MAAFLSEMKTVRLRKVSERSSGDTPGPPSERSSTQSVLQRSLSSLQRSQPAMPLLTSIRASNIDTSTALSESDIRMSEKRKRGTVNIHDDNGKLPKLPIIFAWTMNVLFL